MKLSNKKLLIQLIQLIQRFFLIYSTLVWYYNTDHILLYNLASLSTKYQNSVQFCNSCSLYTGVSLKTLINYNIYSVFITIHSHVLLDKKKSNCLLCDRSTIHLKHKNHFWISHSSNIKAKWSSISFFLFIHIYLVHVVIPN